MEYIYELHGNRMNFLLIRTDFLGDAVLTNTFIKMLSCSTSSNIDVLCTSYNFKAFKYNPYIRSLYIDNYNFSNENKTNYQAIFILNRSLLNYKKIKKINTKKIIGHKLGIKSIRSKFFYLQTTLLSKYKYIEYDNNIHEVRNQFKLLYYAAKEFNFLNKLNLDEKSYFYTHNYNPENNYTKDNNSVVINISGRKTSLKYIPFSLVRNIIEDILILKKTILVIGTEEDKDKLDKLLEYFGQNISIYIDDDIFNLVSKFYAYKYFISADGGLMHVAAGLNMHCIALFHDQNITAWHPWSKNQICLQNNQHRIYDLTSEDVIKAILKFEESNLN